MMSFMICFISHHLSLPSKLYIILKYYHIYFISIFNFCVVLYFQLVVGDIQFVSNEIDSLNTTRTSYQNQSIRVDENDPISDKAVKLDNLCTDDHSSYYLESEAITTEEYAKFSLDSEATDDGNVQQISLSHYDQNLSTTVSEEAECTAAVRVYDLSKRETKILRHNIIKRSRNPVGGDLGNPFDNLRNFCNVTNEEHSQDNSLLTSTIKVYNSRIFHAKANETRKFSQSPTQFKSIHLNRSPRRLKMSDVQSMNDAFGTSLDSKIVDEIEIGNHESTSTENTDANNKLITATKTFVESEQSARNINSICDIYENMCETDENVSNEESFTSDRVHRCESNDSVNEDNYNQYPNEVEKMRTSTVVENSSGNVIQMQPFEHFQDINRKSSADIIVQVNDHKEKSVIEEDVISLLPSVKALAQTFSKPKYISSDRMEKVQRPKVI